MVFGSDERVSRLREERMEKEDVPDASDQDESPFSLPTLLSCLLSSRAAYHDPSSLPDRSDRAPASRAPWKQGPSALLPASSTSRISADSSASVSGPPVARCSGALPAERRATAGGSVGHSGDTVGPPTGEMTGPPATLLATALASAARCCRLREEVRPDPVTTREWCARSRGTAPTCWTEPEGPDDEEEDEHAARECLPLDAEDNSISPMRRSQ
mmetsp:Transcript_60237/g.143100  ORF Transcript_60237/g.143100 Transcript_60237/m.143100 type:complete len:215 (+) Transcript_60237:160-804(+)